MCWLNPLPELKPMGGRRVRVTAAGLDKYFPEIFSLQLNQDAALKITGALAFHPHVHTVPSVFEDSGEESSFNIKLLRRQTRQQNQEDTARIRARALLSLIIHSPYSAKLY